MSDIGNSVWNETDASNTTAAPDGAPEGMAPSGVNDVLRAHQGAIKRWFSHTIPKTTAGTSTAYTLTYTVAPGALVDGMTHLVEFDQANGAAATLNVNALGAKALHYYSAGAWRAVPASLFAANTVLRVTYNSSAGTYRIMNLPDRTGEVIAYAGSTAPAGTLLCYGQAVSRTTYAGLFAALSTTHGTGDGSTTFNLPDLRDRTAVGKGDMGGSAASRITNAVSGFDTTALGSTGGAQSKTASTTVTGTATGSVMDAPNFTTSGSNGSGSGWSAASDAHIHNNVSLSVSASGTSSAFSTVQPTITLNYCIRI